MALTIVIADDEPIVLKSEELFLKKEFPELEIVGQAENGIQLKELLEKLEPDMVMTDIRMPGLTGLEVIELLKRRHTRTHFIVNTAYSDFEYVKKALDLKTDGYLLKPSKREEKLEVIGRLKLLIEEEKEQEQKRLGIDTAISRVNPVLGSEILMSVFADEMDREGFDAYCQINGVRFTRGCIATFLPKTGTNISKRRVNALLEDSLKGVCSFLATITSRGIVVMFMVPEDLLELPAKEMEAWCVHLTELTAMRLSEALGIAFLHGTGHLYEKFEQMTDSYRDSTAALQAKAGVKRTGTESRDAALERIMPENHPDNTNRAETMSRPGQAESIGLTGQTNFAGQAGFAGQTELAGQTSFAERTGSGDGADKAAGYTEAAKDFIDRSYQKDISLQDCAQSVGISPYYLSHIFKEQTGQTFVEYLAGVRIRAAQRLCLETDLTVNDIAQQCGYMNITYFCKVFKRLTGKTIGEYRRTNSEG